MAKSKKKKKGLKMCAADSRWMESECRLGGISEMSSSVQSPFKMVRSVFIRTTAEMHVADMNLKREGGREAGGEKDEKC